MWIWILALLALTVALLIFRLRIHARANRKALGKLMELRLEGLKFQVQDWKGCAYELRTYDTDHHPEHDHFWRGITIKPNAATEWSINIDLQKRYRVTVVQKGQPESWYPKRYGWSTEPWFKKRIDVILWMIAQLPKPHTFEEWLKRSQDEHQAKMAEYDRQDAERQRWMAEQQTIGAFPSLDDPMDDMD